MNKSSSNKLSQNIKELLQGTINELKEYNWSTLNTSQIIGCVQYLKSINNFDKINCLINLLLKIDYITAVNHIIEKYPELVEILQLTQIDVLLRCLYSHSRNCKYISDTQWKIISDYSQTHARSHLQQTCVIHYNSQFNSLPAIFQDIIQNPQYHEYIVKFIQFNIQIYQLDKIFDLVATQCTTVPQYIKTKNCILKIIQHIKTTKWYKDNLIGDSVGYNIENCPEKGIAAQDLRDLFG